MCSAEHPQHWMLCPQCDLMTRLPPLNTGQKASCPRCHTTLTANWSEPRRRPSGYALAALFMLLLANLFPFVNMHVSGLSSEITLMEIPQVMVSEDYASPPRCSCCLCRRCPLSVWWRSCCW